MDEDDDFDDDISHKVIFTECAEKFPIQHPFSQDMNANNTLIFV